MYPAEIGPTFQKTFFICYLKGYWYPEDFFAEASRKKNLLALKK